MAAMAVAVRKVCSGSCPEQAVNHAGQQRIAGTDGAGDADLGRQRLQRQSELNQLTPSGPGKSPRARCHAGAVRSPLPPCAAMEMTRRLKASASSSVLGLIIHGRPSSPARNASPLVSRATFRPISLRRTTVLSHWAADATGQTAGHDYRIITRRDLHRPRAASACCAAAG